MQSEWRADLHCHSTCSDGTFTVEELLDLAVRIGLSAISITDHDTIEAYYTASYLAVEKGLFLLGGVEFSTTFENQSIHVLAYAFDLLSQDIASLCQRHIQRRQKRNRAILELLGKKGMKIDENDLLAIARDYPKKSIGRPHIAQALINKGYISTLKEAFIQYIGDDASCFVRGDAISTEETLEIIHKAGGMAVLAHPHLVDNKKTVEKVLNLPFDGIEGYYGTFNADQNQPWIVLAEKKRLFAVGGSDFHGSIKPAISLGCSWTPEPVFKMLWERFLINNHDLPRLS